MLPDRPEHIAIFGGTFNPVHLGHTQVVTYVLDDLSLDRCFLIPNKAPVHKTIPLVTQEHRLNMLKLATDHIDKCMIDTLELDRKEASYTAYTMTSYRERYPDAHLYFVMGEDSLASLTSWYAWNNILNLCHVIVFKRHPEESQITHFKYDPILAPYIERDLDDIMNSNKQKQGRIYVVPWSPKPDIAATLIRSDFERHAQKMLDTRVLAYIKANALYAL